MLISLHNQATKTPKIRAAIQASEEPAWVVAERYGISEQTVRSQWIGRMRERRHSNVVAVALANKNARIVWSILSRGDEYRPAGMAAAVSM